MAKQQHSYNSGRIRRAGSQPVMGATAFAAPKRSSARPKSSGLKKLAIAFTSVLCIAGLAFGGLYLYLNGLLDPGDLGRIIPGGPDADYEYEPRAYSKKDVLHLLVVGIDYEEGRNYADGLGMTDMILYCEYDLKNNQLNMLQIPRDTFVGDSYATGGSGKINALLISGPNKDAPINNLSGAMEELFRLPVDHFIAIDMDGMKSIVDILGPLRVFVPKTMDDGRGSHLDEGWQWLDGEASEFFVRNRYGVGFERADIDRLDNQRHFYSALFRRFLNLSPRDIVKLLPVFDYYCNTDIPTTDIFDIAFSGLSLKSENVLFCKVPGATGPALDPSGQERNMYFADVYGRGTEEDPGLARLLNEYFRAYGEPKSADQLGLPKINLSGVSLYPPNVQGMAEVQEPEGGANVEVEPTG